MTRKQCLDILELPIGATRDDITKAYRQLSVVWHPDRFPNNPDLQRKAHAKLAQINEAYSALIEGRATPDVSEEPPSDHGTANRAEPASEPTPAYRDNEVRYLGSDPRLKTPSQLGGIIGREGIQAAVEIGAEGMTLVTFTNEGPDEAMWYATPSLLAVEEEQNRWIRSGCSVNWPSEQPENLPPALIRLYFLDPEGILDHLIVVNLKFRNPYYAQLFFKRMTSVIAFQKSTPTPPHSQLHPKPHRTSIAFKLGAMLGGFLYGVLAFSFGFMTLFLTLMFWADAFQLDEGRPVTKPGVPQGLLVIFLGAFTYFCVRKMRSTDPSPKRLERNDKWF